MHSELAMFLWVVGVLLVLGIPRIRKKVKLPRDLRFEVVAPEDLTPRQAEFFAAYDGRIRALGYDDCITYRVTNLTGANLGRTYFGRNVWSRCTVAAITAEKKALTTCWIEFNSNFADGTLLTTSNAQLSSMFTPPPYLLRQSFPDVSDPARLKARHDQRAEALSVRGQVQVDRNNFFEQFQRYHQLNCEFQSSQRLVRLDEQGIYRATTRLAFRGILRFLNPLSDNFTPSRAAVGLLLGTGLPFAATIASVPLTVSLAPRLGLTTEGGVLLITAVGFVLAGASLGVLFQHKVFIWAWLLGFVPAALLGASYCLSFSLLMAWSADITHRMRTRRQAIA